MILELNHIQKSYQQGTENLSILKDINLKVPMGQTVSIMGASGTGKSTLLSIATGLDRPTSGDVIVHGTNLKNLSSQELINFRSQNIGIIFQQFHLLPHLTAIENVALPLEFRRDSDPTSKAEKALSLVGLAERKDHLPQQMSRGECQRVALARVLVTQPKIIFADEPTGSLDEKTADAVMKQLFELTKKNGIALILVTHDPAMAARCEKQYRLHEGRLSDQYVEQHP